MKNILITILFSLTLIGLKAQTEGISINANGNDPDSSAILDVQSTHKGLLTPRMSSNERNAISNPADGLIVYDLDTQTFWYYDNGVWNEIRNGNTHMSVTDFVDTTLACNEEISSVSLTWSPEQIAFHGNYAYVLSTFGSNFNYRFDIIDISDPYNPVLLGGSSISFGGNASIRAIASDGNYLYLGSFSSFNPNKLAFYDVSDPLNPIFESFVPTNSTDFFIRFVIKNNLLIGVGDEGINIFDISDEVNITKVGSLNYNLGTNIEVELSGNYIYVSDDSDETFEIFDISDPGNPVWVSSNDLGGKPLDIVLVGSYLYIIDGTNGFLRTFDVQDPFNPQQKDSLSINQSSLLHGKLTVVGNKIFLHKSSGSIHLIDLSVPESPIVEDYIAFNIIGGISDLEANRGYIYACDFLGNKVRVLASCPGKTININPASGAFQISDMPDQAVIKDKNEDTRVEVEQNPGDDQIRFTAEDKETFLVNKSGIFSAGLVDGNFDLPYRGPGARFFWIPGRAAVRIGEAKSTDWDNENILEYSSVLGGRGNKISGEGKGATIGGGFNNYNTGFWAFLGGGYGNEVTDSLSFLGGGLENRIFNSYSFIGGGKHNFVYGRYGTVAGGLNNIAGKSYSSVVGGGKNHATGSFSLAGGRNNTAASYGETAIGIFAENYSPVSDSSFNANDRLFVIGNGTDHLNRSNALTILKSGFTGLGTPNPDTTLHIAGGFKYEDSNQANGYVLTSDSNGLATWRPSQATLLQGTDGNTYNLRARDEGTTIGNARGEHSVDLQTIRQNNGQVASGDYSLIAGGHRNTASGAYAAALGGSNNQALGTAALVAGGNNTANGNFAAIPGGRSLIADSYGETVVGVYNLASGGDAGVILDADPVFVVGNGKSVSTRSNAMTILKNGHVGIGTDNPDKAKLQINGVGPSTTHQFAYLDLNSNGLSTGVITTNRSYSIWASSHIAATEFHAISDLRVKNILGQSNTKTDLQTLMNIQITDYTFKDSIAKGNRSIKKVVAQQVAEVYPQAVNNHITEVVPDIYRRAEIKDGWIMLTTNLEPGERVKIITEQNSKVYDVKEVKSDRFSVSNPSRLAGEVFIYGREVDDFHTVDYEALSMLNVSATQEQQRIIEAQEERIKNLEARLESFETLIQAYSRNNK